LIIKSIFFHVKEEILFGRIIGPDIFDAVVVAVILEFLEVLDHLFGGAGVGFFQIGGGTAGDFPICCVPMMEQDLGW
jgi:deoxyhypusine synthase